jgi:ankyrin repeat protein
VHVAAECGNVDVLAYLIEKRKLNPEEKSSFDLTPLHRACIAGKLNSVRYLVEKADVRIESKTTDGRTPLSAAANWGQMDIFKYLLDEAGADIRDESVMVLASSSKNPAIADLVKEKLSQNEKVAMGSKFNAADREKIFGMMQQGDITGFLEAKRNYSGDFWAIKNRRGDSVIEYAVSWSPFDMTKCVFSEYPNNFSSGEQFELLKTAVLVGKDEILRYLIEEKRFNPRLDINGVDIFHYATTAPLYPRAEVVRYLVTQQHFDVEKRDPSGKTALLRAANTALYDFTVKCLIEELGADISAKDSAGMNVFQAAALNRQGPAVLEYLVKKFTPDVEKEVGTAVFSTVQNTATKAFLQQYF